MKRILLLALAMVLLAACSTNEPKEPEEAKDENNVEQNESEENEAEVEPEESEEPEEIEEAEAEEPKENSVDEDPVQEDEDNEESAEKDEEKTPKKAKYTEVDDLVDLTFSILKAQNENDYAFLESILSNGSELNKKKNTLSFTNVTYPHEQEFRTEENAADLEHRYVHAEDKESVIVGFAAADYENEYNYVIDFEFILEDGSYKMNDMDINK